MKNMYFSNCIWGDEKTAIRLKRLRASPYPFLILTSECECAMMTKAGSLGAGVVLLAGLGGCAVAPPSGPSVAVMPGQGKSFEAFQSDDFYCRGAAQQSGGGQASAQQATNNAVGSAAVGTALGAAAGALIGSASGAAGGGAAIGARAV